MFSLLFTGFLVFAILALLMPKTYSQQLNNDLDIKVKAFVIELKQSSFADSGKLFDRFIYENNIEQNSDDDRLYLEGHLDKILKDDCTHMEDREIEEDNLLNYNKDTSSSESTAKPEIEE